MNKKVYFDLQLKYFISQNIADVGQQPPIRKILHNF